MPTAWFATPTSERATTPKAKLRYASCWPRRVTPARSVLPRAPKGRESAPMQISRLLHAHEIVIKEARTMARRAAETGDDGTNDLLVSEVIRQNELQAWFLAEHVIDVPLVRG